MFLKDEDTIKFVRLLTDDPSDKNIKTTIADIKDILPNDDSVDAEIELIAMAVEPIHKGITNKLRNSL